jgi:hypothetical protein
MAKMDFAYQDENWRQIEELLSRNLKPVEPNSTFISELRNRLADPEIHTFDSVEKTKTYLLRIVGILTGLILMAVSMRIIVGFLLILRKKDNT